jgi:hypothetical protein
MATQTTMANFLANRCEFSVTAIKFLADIGEYFEVYVATIYLFDKEQYIC